MLDKLARIAQIEFGDIVRETQFIHRRADLVEKIRFLLRDHTTADIWINPAGTRYSFHWEQRAKRGLIHRFDNAPDFPDFATFPRHFHNGAEDQVEESRLGDDPEIALREFLAFVRTKLNELGE